jgi:hypothetical protein
MSNPFKVSGALLLTAAIAGWYLVQTATFYPTGTAYYEACWDKRTRTDAGGEAHASDPYRDIIWSNCEAIARRAMFDAGMIFAGEPESDQDTSALKLKAACPRVLSTLYLTVLDELQASSGPTLADRVTPAEWMAGRVLQGRWPKCDLERRQQGYPKIIEVKAGEFDWGQPCTPCAIRDQQKEEQKKAKVEEDRVFWETERKRWNVVKPAQVEVRQAEVSQSFGADYQVSGLIRNKAAVKVSAIKFSVVAYDCPTKATPVAGCTVIGRASETTYLDAPAGQIAALGQVFKVQNLPQPHGVLAWNFSVDSVRAPLDATDKVPDLLDLVVHSNPRD